MVYGRNLGCNNKLFMPLQPQFGSYQPHLNAILRIIKDLTQPKFKTKVKTEKENEETAYDTHDQKQEIPSITLFLLSSP
jgi:hypothetical protein